jgi:hypothetical protein
MRGRCFITSPTSKFFASGIYGWNEIRHVIGSRLAIFFSCRAAVSPERLSERRTETAAASTEEKRSHGQEDTCGGQTRSREVAFGKIVRETNGERPLQGNGQRPAGRTARSPHARQAENTRGIWGSGRSARVDSEGSGLSRAQNLEPELRTTQIYNPASSPPDRRFDAKGAAVCRGRWVRRLPV